jgi:MYXO-CTERM domain-containing protein
MRASAMALTLALAFDAHAYVRSRTKHGTAVYWPGACIFMQPDSDGTQDLSLDLVTADVQQSITNWQMVTSACAYIQMSMDTPAKLEAHLDGINVVKFRADKWCHPEDSQNHNVCYAAPAAAITTVFYLDRPGDAQDGYIIDADVELNDINFTFVDVMPGQPLPTGRPGTSIADLKNTLTHEFGHVQGLDHTCADSATPANEVDENGNPPPGCNMLGTLSPADKAKIQEATMYNSAQPGETKKQSPEADDIAGICAIYPLDKQAQHSVCKHVNLDDYQTRGCQFMPGPARGVFFVALMALAGLLALRTSRRRRH